VFARVRIHASPCCASSFRNLRGRATRPGRISGERVWGQQQLPLHETHGKIGSRQKLCTLTAHYTVRIQTRHVAVDEGLQPDAVSAVSALWAHALRQRCPAIAGRRRVAHGKGMLGICREEGCCVGVLAGREMEFVLKWVNDLMGSRNEESDGRHLLGRCARERPVFSFLDVPRSSPLTVTRCSSSAPTKSDMISYGASYPSPVAFRVSSLLVVLVRAVSEPSVALVQRG